MTYIGQNQALISLALTCRRSRYQASHLCAISHTKARLPVWWRPQVQSAGQPESGMLDKLGMLCPAAMHCPSRYR